MDGRTLNHAETCRELKRSAALLRAGRITLGQWCESVQRIIAARGPSGSV
jgi:hypothetical protein